MYSKLFYKFLFAYLSQQIPRKNYQLLKIGDQFICSLDSNHDIRERLVSGTGSCGVSSIPELAKIKAISEFVEREAFQESGADSTCGFAAYPFLFNQRKAIALAEVIAFNERVEKYVWMQWGDQNDIDSRIYSTPHKSNVKFYSGIQKEINFLEYYGIMPILSNIENINVVLLYALTKYGWACGAAASSNCTAEAENNALKELYMSGVALYRIHEKDIQPTSFFEKRLFWISQQDALIRSKISAKGVDSIIIPKHSFKDISTQYKDCYVVRQCLFEKEYGDFFGKDYKRLYL